MNELAALQHWMSEALMFPRQVERDAIDRRFLASPRQDAAERLAIYQRSYAARLLRCMDEQFPALRHALGSELFADFAREYLRTFPSRSYTLHELGNRFPKFLEQSRPDRDKPPHEREDWIDFMVDLARFELALFSLFDAPGHEGQPYATMDVRDERLCLQPCFALIETRYAVGEYFHEVRMDRSPAFTPARTCWYALVRKDYLTRTLPLRPAEYKLLASLQEGTLLAEGLAALAQSSGRAFAKVERAWAEVTRPRLIAAGVFIDRDT